MSKQHDEVFWIVTEDRQDYDAGGAILVHLPRVSGFTQDGGDW